MKTVGDLEITRVGENYRVVFKATVGREALLSLLGEVPPSEQPSYPPDAVVDIKADGQPTSGSAVMLTVEKGGYATVRAITDIFDWEAGTVVAYAGNTITVPEANLHRRKEAV